MKSLFTVVFLIFSIFNSLAQAPTNGLVAYYPFNGNANDAVGANHGTVNGATLTTDRHGVAGKAYSFDGVDDNLPTSFTPSNIFSIALWFNPTENQPFNSGLFSTYDTSNFNGIYVGFKTSYPSITQYTDGNQGSQLNTISHNTWQHLIITSDGTTVRTYVNGVNQMGLSNTTSHSSNIVFGDSRFNDRFFKGALDDIRIYNRDLSDAEVQAIYNAEKPQTALIELASLSSNSPICVGQNLVLTPTNPSEGIITYTITGPKGVVNNNTITNVNLSDAGPYTIESFDLSGTSFGAESIQVSILPPMEIVFTSGATSLPQNAPHETYTTNIPNATLTLSPVEAGVIMGGIVDWDENFIGTATITASEPGLPPCGAFGTKQVTITSITTCPVPELQWSSTTATSFRPYVINNVVGTSYVFRYRQQGTSDWTELPPVSSIYEGAISTTISGLTNNTNYEFQVKQICTSGESEYSVSKIANTFCQTFNSGNLNATNVTATKANIQWANNFGVPLKANIRYRKVGDANWVTITEASETVVDYLTNHVITGLDQNSNYEYQIQAVCVDGSLSPFSDSKNFTTLATTPESQDPIAMYPLNGDANDISGNNFHGVVNGTAGFVPGVQGDALHTNVGVSQYVWIQNNTQFDNISKVSLAAWVRPQAFNLSCWSGREMIIGKGQDEVPNGYGISIIRNETPSSCGEADSFNQYKFSFEYGGKSISSSFYNVDNKWRYVTATYDNNILRLFVDGQLVVEQTEGLLDAKNNIHMWFNHATWAGVNSTAGRFGGDLDNIRIYSRAITDAEVLAIYNAEKPQVALLAPATISSNATGMFCAGSTLILTVDNPDPENVSYVVKDPAGQVVGDLTIPNAVLFGNYTIESFNTSTGESIGINSTNVMIIPSMPITFNGGATILNQNAPNETYTTSSPGTTFQLSPVEAGTINNITGEVDWNENFFGIATITAQFPPCGSGQIQVIVNQAIENLQATNNTSLTLCAKSNLELKASATGGTGALIYAWTGPGGYTSSEQNPVIVYSESNPVLAGTYTVTVIDGAGAMASASAVVVESTTQKPILTITSNSPVCPGQNIQLMGSSSIIGLEEKYFDKNGNETNSIVTTSSWINDSKSGTYRYSVKNIDGCISEITTEVIVHQITVSQHNFNPGGTLILSDSFFGNISLCEGGNLTSTAYTYLGNGGYAYEWSGPNSFVSNDINLNLINVLANQSGKYTLKTTDQLGCITYKGVDIQINSNTPINFITGALTLPQNSPSEIYTTNRPINENIIFTLNPAEAGTIYQTPTVNGIAGQVVWSETFSGTATINATGNNPCSSGEVQVTITPAALTVANTTSPTLCAKSNLELKSSATGGSLPYTYNWTGPGGYTSSEQNPIIVYSETTPVLPGTYTATVTDGAGATATASVVLVESTKAPITLSTSFAGDCYTYDGAFVNLITTGGAAPFTFTNSYGFIQGNQAYIQDVWGTAELVATDSEGCKAKINFTLGYPLYANVYSDGLNLYPTTCEGGQINIFPQIISGAGGYVYSWTGPNNFINSDPQFSLTNTTPNQSGIYNLKLTDANGCEFNRGITVTINPKTTINFISGEANLPQNAPNETYTTDAPTGTPLTYTLEPAEAGTVTNSGDVDWNEIFLGTATIKVTDAANCGLGEKSITITPAALTVTNTTSATLCAKSNLELKASANGGILPYTYAWTGPNGYTSSEQNPVIVYAESTPVLAGTYTVTVTDGAGGTGSASVVVVESTKLELTINETILPRLDCSTNITNISVNGTGGDGNYTFTYATVYNGDQYTIPIPINSNEYSTNTFGYNKIYLKDGEGCMAEKRIIIPYYSPFVSAINWHEPRIQEICLGSSFQLLGSHNTVIDAVMSYKWSGPNGFTSNIQNPIIVDFDQNKVGEYKLVVTNEDGCSSEDNDLVLNNPQLGELGKINLNLKSGSINLNIITGPSIIFQNSPNVTYSTNAPNGSNLSYSISPSEAGFISQNGEVDWDDNFIGEAIIKAKINAECGGEATKTVTIKQNLTATIGTITPSNCGGPNVGAVEITPTGGTAPYTITPAQTGLAVGSHTFLITDFDLNTKEVVVEIPNVTIDTRFEVVATNNYYYQQKVCANADNELTIFSNSSLLVPGTYELTYQYINYNENSYPLTTETVELVVSETGIGKFNFITNYSQGGIQGLDLKIKSIKIGNCIYPATNERQVVLTVPIFPNISVCYSAQTLFANPGENFAKLPSDFFRYPLINDRYNMQYVQSYTLTGATIGGGTGNGEIQGSFPYYILDQQPLNLGLTHYTITTNDGCNPPETCTFDVTVIGPDTTPPAITCPANITVPTDEGLPTAVVTYTVTATDDSGTVTTTKTSGLASAEAFPLGETVVTYTATDASGNSATCSFTVTVYERTLPLVEDTTLPTTLPEGSTDYTLPPSSFDVTVPEGGNVASLLITEFPEGAASITIGDITYGPPSQPSNTIRVARSAATNTPFPPGGVSVPTNAQGVPTVPIIVTPLVQNESSTVTIEYVAINDQNKQSPFAANITINFEVPLEVVIQSINKVTCKNGQNGSVAFTISGGNSPYTISPSPTGLFAGSYTFIISDNNGQSSSQQVSISEPDALMLSFTDFTQACDGQPATAKINISGGIEPYEVTVNSNSASFNDGLLMGAMGTYTVIVTDANQCQISSTVALTACVETNAICTLTQNGYSNTNYIACAEDGSSKPVGILLANALNGSPHIFGLPANNRTFTLSPADLSSNIYNMLGGVSNASSKFGLGGASYAVTSTWPRVPLTNTGKIANTLFANTMALYFNLKNSSKLPAVATANILYTESTTACGSNIASGVVSNYQMPTGVISYLNNAANGYSNTVNDLYNLANDALGGKTGLPNLSTIASAVSKVNLAFNGCKLLVAAPTAPVTFGTVVRLTENSAAFDAPAKGGAYITLIEGDPLTGHILGVTEVGSNGLSGFEPVITNTYHAVLGTDPEGSRTPQAPVGYRIVSQKVNSTGASIAGPSTQEGTGIIEIGSFNPNAGAKIAASNLVEVEFQLEAVSPLPVRLILFEGIALETGNKLIWETSSQQNFSHFEIEKSIDAKTFNNISKVNGANNSNENLTYNYLDSFSGTGMVLGAILSTQKTNNDGYYYRLKLVDLNGNIEYSKTIYLKRDNESEIKVYPNPVSDFIYLENTDNKKLNIKLLDPLGREILKLHDTNKSILKISVEGISSGTYFLQIIENGILKYKKVIINK